MLVTLMDCPDLKELVPTYTREVPLGKFIGREPSKDSVVVELQDVTFSFGKDPCIMDIKLGTRTFLESEVDNPSVRDDLLKKMDALDSTAATETERESGGITKLRYMQFRERTSTSSTLGFRLEGLTVADLVLPQANGAAGDGGDGGEACGSQVASVQLEVPSKEILSKISTEEGVLAQLRGFVRGDAQLKELYLQRLRAIQSTLSACRAFSEHQFINSSLLFVHDVRARARTFATTGRAVPLLSPRAYPRPFRGARRPHGSTVACG